MKNNQGQALVEFVIILPIFIFMILAVIDLGKILYLKNKLESQMENIITSYKSNKDIAKQLEEEAIFLHVTSDKENLIFEISKTTEIVTPGLNLIFSSPYKVTSKRVVYNES